MRAAALALAMTAACGGGRAKPPVTSAATVPAARTAGVGPLPLLPDGAQLIVELDLARLRANPIVGKLVTAALAGPPLPIGSDIPMSPLAHVDALVLASYGIGTSQAATVTVLATTDKVDNGV